MPAVSAICENCGAIFPSSYDVDNSYGISFHGNTDFCPKCGGTARVQDGIYDAIGNTLFLRQAFDAIIEAGLSKDHLCQLEQILRNAQAQEESVEETAASVEKIAPAVANLINLFISQKSANLAQILSLLITLIIWLQSCAAPPKELPQTVIEQMVVNNRQQVFIRTEKILPARNIVQQPSKPRNHSKPVLSSKKQKISRNELCSCGSGQKWKRCHGNKAKSNSSK